MELSLKQQQFNAAMARYTGKKRYQFCNLCVAATNVALQFYLLYRLWLHPLSSGGHLFALLLAYLIADFANGLVHLYMDGNDCYESIFGPFIANFHLHHRIPRYKAHSLPIVYFLESGSKIWLAGYLLAVAGVALLPGIPPLLLAVLVYSGVLSSVAEVSHYLCHNSTSPLAGYLAKCGLLLPKRHHARHHLQDNNGYAFLNGWTDPLLDWLAARFASGYKETTDHHYAYYVIEEGEGR